jgi:hypothetical protein
MVESNSRQWQQEWDNSNRHDNYDYEYKARELEPIISKLYSEGKIGPVVADIGSGKLGLSSFLDQKDLKLVRLDIAAPEFQDEGIIQTRMDVDKLPEPDFATKRSIVKIREWLREQGINPGQEPVVDTMIMSDILNYIDYQKDIPAILKYLKPGGRLILLNKPNHGLNDLFVEDSKRIKSNLILWYFLKDLGIETEVIATDNNEDFATTKKIDLPALDQGSILYVGRLKLMEESND